MHIACGDPFGRCTLTSEEPGDDLQGREIGSANVQKQAQPERRASLFSGVSAFVDPANAEVRFAAEGASGLRMPAGRG